MTRKKQTTIVPVEQMSEATREFHAALDQAAHEKGNTTVNTQTTTTEQKSYDELMVEVERLKAELADKPKQAPRQPREAKPKGPSRDERRDEHRQVVRAAWTAFQDDGNVEALVNALHERGVLNNGEAITLTGQSGLAGEPASQKLIAELIGCNTWQVYNYRRDALRCIAEALDMDWEALHEPLGLRRGQPRPERHTRYLPRKDAD